MTIFDKIEPRPTATAITGHHLAVELTETLKLAAPIALTQLGQIAMMTTDLVLIGRLGNEAVAAAALAHTVFFISFTFGMGLMSAVAPLAAQGFGARNPRLVRRALRVGLWAALMISVPIMALPLYGEHILVMLGQAPATAALAQRYLQGLAWGITPALWFLAIRGFMGAVNRPEPGLWITLAAIPANAVLVYLLIHGKLGLPRLDLLGAGLATTTINFGMFLAGLWFAYNRRPFRKYHVLGRIWRIDWKLLQQLIIMGAPISIAFLLEYGLFSAAAILMGLISTTALAAHQIALQVAAILFMVPFGIGMAATVRVGHAVGRNDAAAVKRAGFVATVLGIAIVSTLTLAVILGRFAVARFFFGENVSSVTAAVELTATLLMVGATFFVADGVQTVAAGALRGMNDTRLPLLFAAISYWLIGFSAAYGLAFWARFGAVGVWIGLSCGTAVYAVLLVLRFRWLVNHLEFATSAQVLAMKVHAIDPSVDTHSLLSGAQFSDAFSIVVEDTALDARHAAAKMLGHQPRWIKSLMSLRHRLVTPFGLKTSAPAGTGAADTVGIFPIVSETSDRLVAGFNDKHLDFRVVVDVTTAGQTQRVTATTLVLTHNLLGRVYLTIVLPFHRLIVRALLRQVAA